MPPRHWQRWQLDGFWRRPLHEEDASGARKQATEFVVGKFTSNQSRSRPRRFHAESVLDFTSVPEKGNDSPHGRVKRQKEQGSDSVDEKSWPHTARNTARQEKLRRGKLKRGDCLATAGNRRNEKNSIAFLEGAGFAAKKADVFLVEIDVEELAYLALIVAHVAREVGKARSKLVEGVGDGGRASVYFRGAVGEATERGGNFDSDGHF